MNAISSLLVAWLTDYYLAATLLLLVLLIGWRWMRQPAHRILAAWIVLLELVVLAAVCAVPFWPRVSLMASAPHQLPSPFGRGAGGEGVDDEKAKMDPFRTVSPHPSPLPKGEGTQSWDGGGTAAPLPHEPQASPQRRLTWTERIALVYLAGGAMSCLWLAWGAVATMWLRRRAHVAPAALQWELEQVVQQHVVWASPTITQPLVAGSARPTKSRVPRLLVSRHVPNAVAVGVLRPTIILPARLAQDNPPASLRAVLSHELAHIRNHDLWLLALSRCLLVLLFAHPLFWWLRRAVRNNQELLADAAAAGDNRQDYAQELLRLIRQNMHRSPVSVSAAMGIWEGSSQLSRRIAMLLDETFHIEPTGSRGWKFRALGVLLLLGAACSLVTLQPARSADGSAKPMSPAESSHEEKDRQNDKKPAASAEAEGNEQSAKTRPTSGTSTNSGAHVESRLFVGTSARLGSDADRDSMIALPGYPLLGERNVVKELKITAEQKKALHDIQAKFISDTTKLSKDMERKTLSEEAGTEDFSRRQREQLAGVRRQVEAVLTPEQLQRLKELTFRDLAFAYLANPDVRAKLGLTKEQESDVRSMTKETIDRQMTSIKETADKTLAVLTPKQKTKLREVAIGPLGPDIFVAESVTVTIKGDAKSVFIPSQFPYDDFGQEAVWKKLGLTAVQVKQVRDILGDSPTLNDKLARERKSAHQASGKTWRRRRLLCTGEDTLQIPGSV